MRFASGVIDDDDQFSDQIEALEYANLDKEVRGTLARAKAAVLAGDPVDRIVIACRDIPTYFQSLIAVGREYKIPLDIDHKIPIAETVFGELVSLILETLDVYSGTEAGSDLENDLSGFEYEPTLRLLMHRLGPGITDEARAKAFGTLPSGFDRWKQLTGEIEFLKMPGERSCTEWTNWLAGLMSRWDVCGAKKLGMNAPDVEAYNRFFRSLEQLAAERGTEQLDISEFASDISDVLLNVATPAHLENGGIKVRQLNEIVGSEFDTMFVVGMSEGMLPAAAVDSSVIDLFECEELRSHDIHFQNALEVPRWEAITFYFMLLACRGEVTFSYSLFAGDNERLKSSYFKRLGIIPRKPDSRFVSGVPEYRQAFLRNEEASKDEVLAFAKHQHKVEERRESGAPPDEYDGVIGTRVVRNSWSASSLGKIGSCPFKWFASDLLRLRAPEESDTDLPPRTRGNLLHKTLELAVERSIGAADLRSAVHDALESAFAEAETLDDSLTLITNWQLRRIEQIEKLRVAVASDHFVLDDATVVEVEKPFEAEFCGLTIKGTIDRIDELSDGRMLAVDYKHGAYLTKVKDENGLLSVEIQLPLYALVALPKLYPGKRATGRFFHLSDPKKTDAKEIDLVGFISRIKTMLDTGNFAVDPDQQRHACEYCEFDVVCRVGPRLERRSNKA
jgi:ATP-dependent helicase/DNAse subunit B